jgi:hypothetical protein
MKEAYAKFHANRLLRIDQVTQQIYDRMVADGASESSANWCDARYKAIGEIEECSDEGCFRAGFIAGHKLASNT